jgi:hypothetical protein
VNPVVGWMLTSQLNAANLHGAIDEVKLYNRVLTSREIKNHYDWISQ